VDTNLKSWAILQFKPNAHKIAERNLNQQGFETFLPLEAITKFRKQKYISVQRPLFPGYMFVAYEKENVSWHKIKNTFGVSKLLTINGEPCIIPDFIITGMMEQCSHTGILLTKNPLSKNDHVRIVSGPFNNFLAKVISTDQNQRVWVLINFMGQSTRALVKAEKLNLLLKK